MDNLVYEILFKLEEVKRIKKVKAYYDELLVLEELQIKAVLRLMKAKLMIEILVKGETISKEKLSSDEIKYYRINKMETVTQEFKKVKITLIDEEEDIDRYAKKEKKKEPKKSTIQETFELWQQQLSVAEIASIRKLTEQTIGGHLAKLIEAKSIKISEVLPEDKIMELAEAFKGFEGNSVTELKEKYGEKFSWDELKMFKASL
jgi:uncharacterized protein YpbB